jgi:hypothetical protein
MVCRYMRSPMPFDSGGSVGHLGRVQKCPEWGAKMSNLGGPNVQNLVRGGPKSGPGGPKCPFWGGPKSDFSHRAWGPHFDTFLTILGRFGSRDPPQSSGLNPIWRHILAPQLTPPSECHFLDHLDPFRTPSGTPPECHFLDPPDDTFGPHLDTFWTPI